MNWLAYTGRGMGREGSKTMTASRDSERQTDRKWLAERETRRKIRAGKEAGRESKIWSQTESNRSWHGVGVQMPWAHQAVPEHSAALQRHVSAPITWLP